MASSLSSPSLHSNHRTSLSKSNSSSPSIAPRFNRLPQTFTTLRFNPYFSKSTYRPNFLLHLQATSSVNPELQRKKHTTTRKPKPSFYDQISEKWSRKPTITTNLPWRQEGQILSLEVEKEPQEVEVVLEEKEDLLEKGEGEVSSVRHLSSDAKTLQRDPERFNPVTGNSILAPWDRRRPTIPFEFQGTFDDNCSQVEPNGSKSGHSMHCVQNSLVGKSMKFDKEIGSVKEAQNEDAAVRLDSSASSSVRTSYDYEQRSIGNNNVDCGEKSHFLDNNNLKVEATSSSSLPWVTGANSSDKEEGKTKKSNTELADNTIPEHELKRLRNVALRMVERTKVGEAGITRALVDAIHDHWKVDEIVKLKFEGSLSLNMRRTHEILERKTGGLVIWRSGSTVVLFRGLNYNLDCVKSYNKSSFDNVKSPEHSKRSNPHDSLGLKNNIYKGQLMDADQLNDLLDDLGPRFDDWTGGPPIPVDADLLPGSIPGYRSPFRLLPYGTRSCLTNKQTTFFRRQARRMSPHFALGKNRELQGLAAAMVKFWEKSAIVKIAIKRGVLNTCNDKMAEELKKLTGGTLLSRNKEYIVFYRGNDFLPPLVTEILKEREKVTALQHQEEEARREALLMITNSTIKHKKGPMVAGTLAETAAATSRWAKQPSSDDLDKMLKDSAVARHASLIKYLEKKLAVANAKIGKARNALAKAQESLDPSELPSDSEYITDEERYLFRKMGLSMKPYLLLGRRGVFDGTVENIHLHWKFRELVKIIVKGKSFAHVQQIAISLEAESGGVFVSIDKTINSKGYAIILYRGKNYQQPLRYRPRNLLTKRQALARSVELQRCEALKHHISDLHERIELIKSELNDMNKIKEIDDKTFYEILDDTSYEDGHEDCEEDEGEEAY